MDPLYMFSGCVIYLRLTNTRYVYGTSAFASLKMNECSFQDTVMQKYILQGLSQGYQQCLTAQPSVT